MKLFDKGNSRFLSAASGLLLGQVGIGVVYFLILVGQGIFAADGFRVESAEWVRTLTMILVGAGMLGLVNADRRMFGLGLSRAEKVFKLLALGIIDAAVCMAVSYLLILPFSTSDLSQKAIFHSIANSTAIGAVFLGLLVVVPKLKVFEGQGSRRFNGAMLILVLGLGTALSRLATILISGPDGSSEITREAFAEQVLRYGLASGILGLGIFGIAMRQRIRRWVRLGSLEIRKAEGKLRGMASKGVAKKKVAGSK